MKIVKKHSGDGLHHRELLTVKVGPDGTIYSGHKGGGFCVSKHNGAIFVNNKHEDIQNLSVSDIKFDKNGVMYVATDGGLFISKDNGVTFDEKNESHGLQSKKVKKVYFDNANNVYCLSNLSISVSKDNCNSFIPLENLNNPFNQCDVHCMLVDSTGVIYVGTNNKFLVSPFQDGVYLAKNSSNGLPSETILDLVCTPDDTVYTLTYLGLVVTKDKGETFVTKLQNKNGAKMNCLHVDEKNNIYVGTSEGLHFSLDGGDTFTIMNDKDGLPAKEVTSIAVDSTKGRVYLGIWSNLCWIEELSA